MSEALLNRLDAVFTRLGPLLDPYFMEGLQSFLRFVSADTSCYNRLYAFISELANASTSSETQPDIGNENPAKTLFQL